MIKVIVFIKLKINLIFFYFIESAIKLQSTSSFKDILELILSDSEFSSEIAEPICN